MKFPVFDQEWSQILAILTAALVSFNSAVLFSWPSPSIPILLSDNFPENVTMEEASYTTVIPSVSAVLSSPLYPFLMDRIGRKVTLLSVAIPQLVSWILIAVAGSMELIYVSRFFSGFVSSCVYATLPVYIAEVASPKVRGLWGNAMSFYAYFGICVMTILGTYLSIKNTAYVFIILTVVFFALFALMPETPYYCVMKGKTDAGLKNLSKLRRNDDVSKEFEDIQLAVTRQINEPSKLLDLIRVRSNLKAMVLCIAVRAAQQLSGFSAFAVYAPFLFQEAACQISASTSAIIYTSAVTLGSFTGSIFLDRLGRRLSLLISCVGCAVMLMLESAYYYYAGSLLLNYKISIPYYPLIGMLLYVPLYNLGLGIIPNLMLGEMFPSGVKSKALCILDITFSICSAASTKIFQLLYTSEGIHAPFLLFGLCCLVNAIFVFVWFPETSGQTLEEIQVTLKSKHLNNKKSEQINVK